MEPWANVFAWVMRMNGKKETVAETVVMKWVVRLKHRQSKRTQKVSGFEAKVDSPKVS